MKFNSLVLFAFAGFISCATDPGFSDTPEIEFISFSKDTMVQNSLNTDSTFLTIAFRDGDGDIGTGKNGVSENIVLTDSRTGTVFDRFKIPDIPVSGIQSGIEGEITMKVFTTCCIFPDGTPPCLNPPDFKSNELSFEIEMIDDNGNRSGKVISSTITLLCD
ncbi:MAG: hypothetical protein ACO3M5_06255 [Saprospiraceae bacterium]|jgi:hypothetical protein